MGATTTMFISRRDALAALARLEFAKLSDAEVDDRLNYALRKIGYRLDEVSISSESNDGDLEALERMPSIFVS
jgi:hypothetical protein